jgi:hypothetical protein
VNVALFDRAQNWKRSMTAGATSMATPCPAVLPFVHSATRAARTTGRSGRVVVGLGEHEISDIVTDPRAWASATGGRGSVILLRGYRSGVTIQVAYDTRTGIVRSGFPISLPRNP